MKNVQLKNAYAGSQNQIVKSLPQNKPHLNIPPTMDTPRKRRSDTILGTFYRDSLRTKRFQRLITLSFGNRWV